MRHAKIVTALALTSLLAFAGCKSMPDVLTTTEMQSLKIRAEGAQHDFEARNPALRQYFSNSYAYAIFPSVSAGAAGIGAAHGDGLVYEGGRYIGTADVTSVNVGLSLGGQRFSEVVFFQNQSALAAFKTGTFEFDARASAVAASKGTRIAVDYVTGVRVFTQQDGGLMFEASVGGQKFRFLPSNQ